MRSLLQNAWFSTFSTSGAILLCGLATGVMSARLLHADGRGALAAIILWPTLLAGVVPLGISEALTQRISAKRDGQEEALSTALILSVGFAAVASVAGCVILPFVLGHEHAQLFPLAALYTVLFIPVTALTLVLYSFDHGQLRFWRYNLSRAIVPLFYTAALVSLWLSGSARLQTIVAANLAATAGGMGVSGFFLRRSIRLKFSSAEARRLLSLAWQFDLTALLLLLSTQADRMLIVKFWDNRSVGLYFVALTIGTTASGALAHVFHTVIFPNMARQSGRDQQRDYLARSLRHIMFLTFLCTIAIVILSQWLLPFAFGKEFKSAVSLSIILAIGQFPCTLCLVIVRALRGLGEGRPGIIAEALAAVTFLIFALPLGTTFGMTGIAWATCAGNLASLLYVAVHLRRRLQLAPRDWFGLDYRTASEMVCLSLVILKGTRRHQVMT